MQESEEGDSAGAANHHFVKQALQPLVSMLLEQLVKQEEGQARSLLSGSACCRAVTSCSSAHCGCFQASWL